ncbi:cytochrome P450 2J2-like [Denticeps clupeoides]|uniref:cytochrome P450 2J2-like n=1 Tax=Denticeps clupeoides TaxID=299321 RepID=UPI0010A3F4AE|nr:cytochrome P450 2J2-like [Denticeps clupeoides]
MELQSIAELLDLKALLLFLLAFLLIADFLKNRNPPNYPPGPFALPFAGNVFSASFKQPHIYLKELHKAYGNIFGFRLGAEKVVCLTGYKMVKEALVVKGDNFVDRPFSAIADRLYPGSSGLFFSNGNKWKRQRRFTLSTLRNFGLGKTTLEVAICEESRCLLEAMESQKGDAFDPSDLFIKAVGNIICQLVFGQRYDYSDHTFQRMLNLSSDLFKLQASAWAQIYEAFPGIMKRLPGPHNDIFTHYDLISNFIRKEVNRHKDNFDPANPRDYIDAFLTEMKENPQNVAEGFYESNLIMNSLDMFSAGTETTSTTLRWALLILMKYPDIQEKVQAEIDSVIGQSRPPNMSDRPNLPYTDAVIHEIQRRGNIIPLNAPRMASKDTALGGYIIPRGTTLFTDLTSVLFDESEWETPESFNPSHFLDAEGRFRKPEAFIPFSAGKRACLGEQLARMEIFLFFVSLFQKFRFSTQEGTELSLEGTYGIAHVPHPFKIYAHVR